MKKTKLFLFLLPLFIVLLSCSESSKYKDNIYEISFAQIDKTIPISMVFESIDIYPLESDNVPLIGKIGKHIIYDSLIFIHDKSNHSVLTFDFQGKFKSILKKRGKGPGEYLEIQDIDINPFDKTIDILIKTGQVNQYSFNGDFVGSYEIPPELKAAHYFINLNHDVVVFNNITTEYRLHFYSRSDNKFFYKDIYYPELPITEAHSPFIKQDGKVSFFQGALQKRYIIEEKGLIKDYEINLLEYNMEDYNNEDYNKIFNEFVSGTFNKAFYWANTENDQFIVTSLKILDANYSLIINKITKNIVGLKRFSNDVAFPHASVIKGKALYAIIPSFLFEKYINNSMEIDVRIKNNNKISEYGNPVLIKYNLR